MHGQYLACIVVVLFLAICNMIIWRYKSKQKISHISVMLDTQCTFPVISQQLRYNGQFRQSGKWLPVDNVNLSSNTKGYYDPEVCILRRKGDTTSWLSSCLHDTNTRSILFFGDSNQRSSSATFINRLEKREGMKCHNTQNLTTRNEEGHLTIDKSKFKLQGCKWLHWREFVCLSEGKTHMPSFKVTVRYIQVFWLKENISFVNQTDSDCPDVINKSVNTIQEYILGEYAERTKPDLIILGSTAHTRYLSVKQWTDDQKWLIEKVDQLLPKSTYVVWLSQKSWRTDKIPWGNPYFQNNVTDNGTEFTIDEQIRRQNDQFYKVLKTKLEEGSSHILPFFDLYHMSRMVQYLWYKDHLHCHRYYYDGVHEALFETYCNSFQNDKTKTTNVYHINNTKL